MRLFTILLCFFCLNAFAGMNYGSVQTDKEKKIEAIRNEEIRAVKTALSLRSRENRKAELYFRLAELYLEAYRADFLLEGRLQEQALQKNSNAKFIKERTTLDLRNGIGAAEEILTLNVDSKKLDKVYYFLGYYYAEYGDAQKSAKYYKTLAKEYPQSPFAAEGYRSLGEEAFGKGNYDEAQGLLEQAITKTKDPSQQARIYHKLAWCYYRKKRTQDAIETMKKGIALAQGDQEKFLSIREEGLRDLAIYYAETGRVDEAISYFRKNAGQGENGEEKLIKVLEKLGREYERTGQTEKAQQVYQTLLQFKRSDDSSFRVAVKMIDLDLMKQEFDSAYQRLKNLAIPRTGDAETQLAISNLKKQVRNTAIGNHERYRKMDEKAEVVRYLRVADQFYALYLSRYVTDKSEKNEIRMYLAEVKSELRNPGSAAQLYKLIIQDQDPKYAQEAARLWLVTLAEEMKKVKASGEKPGSEPSELERDFVSASDLVEKSIPNSVQSREARLRSAQILADYSSEKQQAIQRAARLAKEAPSTPQGVMAALLWLQQSPSPDALASISSNSVLLETDRQLKGDLAKEIDKVSRDLRVTEIGVLEKGKNHLEAARKYEQFAKDAKSEKEAENSYVGAIGNYAKAQSSEDVFRVMKLWKARFPKSKAIEPAVKDQATLFLIQGLYNDSAELFLGIGRQFKDYSSYQTAAYLFDGGLQPKKAIEVYKLMLKLASNDEARAEVYTNLALVYSSAKDDLGVYQSWKSCASMSSALQAKCGTQLGLYSLGMNDTKQAMEAFSKVVAIKKGSSAKSHYKALAQFKIAQLLEKEIPEVSLSVPMDQLETAFQKKIKSRKPAIDAYEKAQSLSGPWGVAATERLGELDASLAQEIQVELRNPKATEEVKQVLNQALERLNQASLSKAKDAYQYAFKEEEWSPALPVIHDRLVSAGLSGFHRAQGARAGIKLIGISPDGGKSGAASAFSSIRAKLMNKRDDASLWIDYGNLLWGSGKPGLSKIAYRYALSQNANKADALNNLGVIQASEFSYENWEGMMEAMASWKASLKNDPNQSAANYNLGHFFNYYRLFGKAIPYFEKIVDRFSLSEIHDGLGVAYFATGRTSESELQFKKAEELDARKNRFVKKFIEAVKNESKPSDCMDSLEDIPNYKELRGFEKLSFDRLKERCKP